MTLEEAIRHAEEVAQKNEDFVRCHSCDRELRFVKRCQKCAEEQRQLAEWLRELKRADTLLKATYDLLNKQHGNYYVLNLLAETVYYDEAECDGNCLMEDIDAWMDERGIDHETTRD